MLYNKRMDNAMQTMHANERLGLHHEQNKANVEAQRALNRQGQMPWSTVSGGWKV
jgi:hypothetical protein